tara:strand:+ start:110 stop:373 length:264 start_codon:yes stop_codon:yes gene_type:complete
MIEPSYIVPQTIDLIPNLVLEVKHGPTLGVQASINSADKMLETENPVFRGLVERYLPYKYSTESHVALTPDGYLLKIFRVLPENADP